MIIMIIFSCKKENHHENIKVTLINFENIQQKHLLETKNNLLNYFNIDTIISANADLPGTAFYLPRNRYRADSILNYLEQNFETEKVIGLTNKDISTSLGKHNDWGIMGLARLNSKPCVVSTFRTFRNAKNEKHRSERLRKVVFHEFGHTLGLRHCDQNEQCIMRDANGKVSTVDQVQDFCKSCKAKISKYLKLEN